MDKCTVFHILVIVNNISWNIGVQESFVYLVSVLLEIHLVVDALDPLLIT